MKKSLLIIAALVFAVTAQAATLDWRASKLEDNGGPLDDGGGYALAGVDLYLVYNGINAGTPFVFEDFAYDTDTSALTLDFGSAVGTIVDTYTTVDNDYNNTGAFAKSLAGAALTWLGETSGSWDDMNLRNFTIIAISDADGNYAAGANVNYFTGYASGFNNGQTDGSTGTVDAGTFDASGAGLLKVIPEPATIGLFGLGALSAWILRRNKAKQA